MRILLLNPNTDEAMTAALAGRASKIAPPDVEIVPATVPFGPPLLSRRRDIAIGAAAVLAGVAERAHHVEAVVVGSFSDPGVDASREVSGLPTVGLCEAGTLTAAQLGARIGLLLGSRPMVPVIEERLRVYGLRDRVTGIRTPPDGVRPGDGRDVLNVFCELAAALVEHDGAEVVVLGGGKLIGLASAFNKRLPVPVIDSVDCAVLQAYALARLGARRPAIGSYSPPRAVAVVGLPPSLTDVYAVTARAIDTGSEIEGPGGLLHPT